MRLISNSKLPLKPPGQYKNKYSEKKKIPRPLTYRDRDEINQASTASISFVTFFVFFSFFILPLANPF